MYCSTVCGLCTTQYPIMKYRIELKQVGESADELTDWNCCRLNCRGRRLKRRHFHLEHLCGHTAVELAVVFIVMVEELARNVIILTVDVVRLNFRFWFGWTVISLRKKNMKNLNQNLR